MHPGVFAVGVLMTWLADVARVWKARFQTRLGLIGWLGFDSTTVPMCLKAV